MVRLYLFFFPISNLDKCNKRRLVDRLFLLVFSLYYSVGCVVLYLLLYCHPSKSFDDLLPGTGEQQALRRQRAQ